MRKTLLLSLFAFSTIHSLDREHTAQLNAAIVRSDVDQVQSLITTKQNELNTNERMFFCESANQVAYLKNLSVEMSRFKMENSVLLSALFTTLCATSSILALQSDAYNPSEAKLLISSIFGVLTGIFGVWTLVAATNTNDVDEDIYQRCENAMNIRTIIASPTGMDSLFEHSSAGNQVAVGTIGLQNYMQHDSYSHSEPVEMRELALCTDGYQSTGMGGPTEEQNWDMHSVPVEEEALKLRVVTLDGTNGVPIPSWENTTFN